jgi:hypothetical protein
MYISVQSFDFHSKTVTFKYMPLLILSIQLIRKFPHLLERAIIVDPIRSAHFKILLPNSRACSGGGTRPKVPESFAQDFETYLHVCSHHEAMYFVA